jgi:hypothetical protein
MAIAGVDIDNLLAAVLELKAARDNQTALQDALLGLQDKLPVVQDQVTAASQRYKAAQAAVIAIVKG